MLARAFKARWIGADTFISNDMLLRKNDQVSVHIQELGTEYFEVTIFHDDTMALLHFIGSEKLHQVFHFYSFEDLAFTQRLSLK